MKPIFSVLAAWQTRGQHPLRRRLRAEHLRHLWARRVEAAADACWLVYYLAGVETRWYELRFYWRFVLEDTRLAWRLRWLRWGLAVRDARVRWRFRWQHEQHMARYRRLDVRLLLLAAALWPLLWALWLAR